MAEKPRLRFIDAHGRRRKLDDVYREAEHAMRARLAHLMRRLRQARESRGEVPVVILRGNCVGGVHSGGEREPGVPERNLLIW